jgi:hypothetical protein
VISSQSSSHELGTPSLICQHWTGARHCGATKTRPYMVGRRCADHTPARLAGRPEPGPLSGPPSEPRAQPEGASGAQDVILRALRIARDMVRAGIPIFTAHPTDQNELGFFLPRGWEKTRPNVYAIDHWKPGMALCAVGGVAGDFIDIDPRNGGDVPAGFLQAQGFYPKSYGQACTPSGGKHDLIAPLGIRKAKRDGIDYQGGDVNGDGRGFVFIAPTVRASKVTCEMLPYVWVNEPDLVALKGGDETGAQFKQWVIEKPKEAQSSGPPTAPGYGSPSGKPSSKAALAGLLRKVANEKEGNRQSIGRWAANRLLENGYPPGAWDALEQAMRHSGADNHDVRTALRDRPDGRVAA